MNFNKQFTEKESVVLNDLRDGPWIALIVFGNFSLEVCNQNTKKSFKLNWNKTNCQCKQRAGGGYDFSVI